MYLKDTFNPCNSRITFVRFLAIIALYIISSLTYLHKAKPWEKRQINNISYRKPDKSDARLYSTHYSNFNPEAMMPSTRISILRSVNAPTTDVCTHFCLHRSFLWCGTQRSHAEETKIKKTKEKRRRIRARKTEREEEEKKGGDESLSSA